MSYDLFNQSTSLCRTYSRPFWTKALELARLYGWQPMGTCLMPAYEFRELVAEWLGTYLTNDGQVVRTEDACSLADALESSLEDIADVPIETDWDFTAWLEDDLPEWLSPEERELVEEELQEGLVDIQGTHPLEFFAGEEKYHLAQLIRFCRLGSFEIS